MSDLEATGDEGRGPVEVRVFRAGKLLHTEQCESYEQASAVVDQWLSEGNDVEYEIDDLSYHHHPGEIEEPEIP